VTVQSVEEVSLGVIRSEIPDERGLGRVFPQTFHCRQIILHLDGLAYLF
jgi:hypothetical protein